MGRRHWMLGWGATALFAGVGAWIVAMPGAHARGGVDRPNDAPSAAVVELFTSEGCSSCPPADAVLERLDAAARASGRPVLTLAFHVDYWDDLGWPDPFASPDFTARQRDYAGVLHGSGLYTPEMIVGGRDAFVGSDAGHAETSVARMLSQPLPLRVTLRVTRTSPTEVRVHHELAGALPSDATLLIAVTERTATVDVKRGENAGRSLHHTDIVRAMKPSPIHEASGDDTIRLPWSPRSGEADVTAIVQRSSGTASMAVLGANREAVPQ